MFLLVSWGVKSYPSEYTYEASLAVHLGIPKHHLIGVFVGFVGRDFSRDARRHGGVSKQMEVSR